MAITYLLDTNAVTKFVNPGEPSLVRRRIAAHAPGEVALCDVVRAELYYGAYKGSRTEENLALIRRLFPGFPVFAFDGKAADVCGRIRAELARKGTPIGPYDLQIAAIALAHGLILVTHNVKEFSRVDGLQIEDWEV